MPVAPSELVALTAQITSAHCANNSVGTDALPGLIRLVYQALATVDEPAAAASEAPVPAVPIKRSVFPDYLVCLEDGKTLKMLKRHLQSSYGMTPDDYRAKWGLPASYPMVAPNYTAARSVLAKEIGLGRRTTPEPVEAGEPEVRQIPAVRRGRRKKLD